MFPDSFKVSQKNFIPSIYENVQTPQASGIAFGDFLVSGGEQDLAAFEAIRLYSKCLPMAAAIDMRAQAFANLTIKVYDKTESKFVKDQNHPILKLLAKPNSSQTRREFMIAFASYYDIVGNTFLTVSSINENRPPLEIFSKNPVQTIILPSTELGTAGFAGQYLITDPYAGQTTFKLDDTGSNRFRYFADDRSLELWHAKRFNPLHDGNHLYGSSAAQPIWLEIQQYIQGNKTNFSSLTKGVRPSGAFVNTKDTPLTDTQWTRLQEMVKLYSGSEGTGKAFAGDGIDFKPTQIPNREMEFQKLQEDMFQRISYRYNIPLPLLSNKASSYNNLATSLFQFYDLSVSPLAEKLLEELTAFIMPRYPNSENLELRFDKAEVDALRLRSYEEAKVLRTVSVNSDNEIRTVIGYEETEGGDLIYKPTNLVPAGMDTDTTGNDQDPPLPSKFIEIMMQTKKADGELYTAAEAYTMAVEQGLLED